MKNCGEQEALKMEAYLKFYAEYFGSKADRDNGGRTGKKTGSSQRPSNSNRRKNK